MAKLDAGKKNGKNKSSKERISKSFHKLKKHYRLVIMNDDNFEIKTSMKLTPLNVMFITSIVSLLFAIIIISLIVFTPLRQNIPGYEYRGYMKNQLVDYKFKLDSLEDIIFRQSAYLSNIRNILRGDIDTTREAWTENPKHHYDTVALGSRSVQDSLLRVEMERKQNYGILVEGFYKKSNSAVLGYFASPLSGVVTREFDRETKHYGIDIVAPKNTAIKAVGDGIVLFAGWTAEDGHVLMIQHKNNLISTYKHNSVLLKKVGNFVRAGDAIAIIGNSGELSQGPHLHFELWHDLIPVNPKDYVNFSQ